MKTILFVAFQSENQSNGGMESATKIFEALSDNYKWIFVTNKASAFTERWKTRGADTHILDFKSSRNVVVRWLSMLRFSLSVGKILASSRVNIMHGNDIRSATILGIWSRIFPRPVIFSVRDTKTDRNDYSLRWRLVSSIARRLIVLSGEMKTRIVSMLGVPPEKIYPIYSLVDLEIMRPKLPREKSDIRNELNLPDGRLLLVCVAAINPKKGQLKFIQNCLPTLFDRCSEMDIHFIGDFNPDKSSYAKQCLDSVAKLGFSDRIHFHGFSSKIEDWYTVSDVVLVASQREGLARCMIEAMASGTPVISFDVCSAREMLEERGAGKVVPLGNYRALSVALADILRCPDKRAEMGRNGRRSAEELFSKENTVRSYTAVYDSVL